MVQVASKCPAGPLCPFQTITTMQQTCMHSGERDRQSGIADGAAEATVRHRLQSRGLSHGRGRGWGECIGSEMKRRSSSRAVLAARTIDSQAHHARQLGGSACGPGVPPTRGTERGHHESLVPLSRLHASIVLGLWTHRAGSLGIEVKDRRNGPRPRAGTTLPSRRSPYII